MKFTADEKGRINNDCFQDDLLEEEAQKEFEEDLDLLSDKAIRQAVVTGTDWTTETILSQINKGNILLNPGFQRRDAWTKKRKSEFIESLILGLPVPQLVLAERKDQRGKYIVLDGKQRLLSVRQFASEHGDSIYEPLKLSGLKVRTDINGKSLADLRADLQFYDYLSAFENQPIRTVIIKNWPNESFLYHVFLRLNMGSVVLSPQELRQALHPGPFVSFVDESSRESPALRDILNNDKPDFRMRDAELLVRYYAFIYFISSYTGNLKLFLDETCRILNSQWSVKEAQIKSDLDEFENAHQTIKSIFGIDTYRKWTADGFERRFNRAVFDIMMFAFHNNNVRDALLNHSPKIVSVFKRLSESDKEFLSSIEQTTKSMSATYTRLSRWAECLNKEFGVSINVPHFLS